MQNLNLNKLFKNKPDLIDDQSRYYDDPKKLYFYSQGNGLVNNLRDHAYMHGYFTSDTFFGLIQKLFNSNFRLNTYDFFHYVYENLESFRKQVYPSEEDVMQEDISKLYETFQKIRKLDPK